MSSIEFIPSHFSLNQQNKLASEYRDIDIDYMNSFRTIISEWCLKNEFLVRKNVKTCIPNISNEDKIIQRAIYYVNFRGLLKEENLTIFLKVLKDTEDDFKMSRIIDLVLYLTTYFDSMFLNRYINKFYHGLSVVTKDSSWYEKIHEQYPFFWVLYAIQVEMHANMPLD